MKQCGYVCGMCVHTDAFYSLVVDTGAAASGPNHCCCSCRCCCGACCYCCRYGYTLAAGAVGRGRGSRALLRQALMLPTTRYRKSRFFRHSAHTIAAAAGAGAAAAAGVRQGVRAVVHDASYWSCLQLSGQQQQLVQLLQQVRCVVKVVTGSPSHRAHWQEGCYKGHASNYVATDPSHGGTQPARKGAAARAH
jgi:hypothetical protein